MNPDQNEPSLEDSIKEVLQTLPVPVRDYIAQRKYSPVVQRLMRKYQLHIDQGAVLEREVMLLLLGIDSPPEFLAALGTEGTIPKENVLEIMTDLNQEIFIPLQQVLRAQGGAQIMPEPEKPRQAPPPVTPMPRALNRIAMPPPNLPGAMSPNESVFATRNASSGASLTNPLGLLADHEEPHIEVKKTAPPPARAPSPNPPQEPRPDIKAYGIDPYREPFEGNEV